MNDILFLSSKIFGMITNIDFWLFTIFLMFLWLMKNEKSLSPILVRFAGLIVFIFLLIGFLPVGAFLLIPLERSFSEFSLSDKPKAIVLLGGSEEVNKTLKWEKAHINDAGDRYISVLKLSKTFPETKIIFSGGNPSLEARSSEADAARLIFNRLGISEDRVLYESSARNTFENSNFILENFSDFKEGPIILVTSAFHMPRSVNLFCSAGFSNIIPYKTDFRSDKFKIDFGWNFVNNYSKLVIGLKEFLGLGVYKIIGRTDKFWPELC